MKKDAWINIFVSSIIGWLMVVGGGGGYFMAIDKVFLAYWLGVPVILFVIMLICIKIFSDPEDYSLLLPHLKNLPYDDTDGAYPEYKGQNRTHYKILNRGDSDPKSWKLCVARKEEEEWVELKNLVFSSKKEGTLVPAPGERGFFVPSILTRDDRYDFNNSMMLVKIIYTDVMDKRYCTCQLYNNGKVQDTYINTEEERRKKLFLKNVDSEGKCKDCRWEKLVAK